MDIKKILLIIVGIALMAYGFRLMGVPLETAMDEVLIRVKRGQIAIMLGGICMIIAVFRK